MDNSVKSRISAALFGLATGEALSWSGMFEQLHSLPPWITRVRREIEERSDSAGVTSAPLPFSLNQPVNALETGPGDLTEWAVWTMQNLLNNHGEITSEILHSAWMELARLPDEIRGRVSLQAALNNFRHGLSAPQSGQFNPHYFDDGALSRAVVIGVMNAGNVEAATQQAGIDASFTQFQDGLWSANALSAAISLACAGNNIETIRRSAMDQIPVNSLAYRKMNAAIEKASISEMTALELVVYLANEISSREYSYGNIAHEILAGALAIITKTQGNLTATLGLAALVPRMGNSLPAIAGALAGSLSNEFPEKSGLLHSSLGKLRGNSIPKLKDVDFSEITNRFATFVEKNILQDRKGSDRR